MTPQKFVLDSELLQSHIEELGTVGLDPISGELFRPVYSQSWLMARNKLEKWMSAAGLDVRVDAVGNLFGRLPGETDAPVVLSGSHLDTVRNGGRYDGALGIHAALAAVSAIASSGRMPRCPIEVVALCEEEGSRFTSPMWGTQAILGLIPPGVEERLKDEDGVTIGTAMQEVGLTPGRIKEAVRQDIGAFVELHIEQGGTLESDEIALGVVDAISGQRHLNVTVRGTQNHAGTTPMDLRADALAAAAEMMLALERIARELRRPAVATVGFVSVKPGSRNVVPGEVTFTVDIRHPSEEALNGMIEAMQAELTAVGNARQISTDIESIFYRAPTPMSPAIARLIGKVADELGVNHHAMPSGAGHDSQLFATQVPTGMIFTPSIGGISHSSMEFTPIEMITPCAEVLAEVLWRLANPSDDV